ncbi:MAG: glycerol-3-phosphate dehydrogenase/oxidase [candidate division KSB1 bacterium]|nr:glycerol-3-phosphate dehydrogenase/oxidase [candidate division KSB1 bacterium]MDZ7334023.1 glycerol-3-phosphate dehydrogenase/oxidase [candidate division KSB1 bacterium]MDZ7357458.1 glycerol-3-phosphate dehydrogenase/oxidase [candidate division KSB1 bacterium]MDZ7400008.1 glycerol-3-phosphate dehydrogenase/oxidase [candidate division KSB1 bacterium]
MKRDLNELSKHEYDVVIVGAGIYGVNAAWDATLRGLKVALIDKGDFGCATSSNSLKTIHGGIRYLQNLDFKRMRESIHERMILMKIAPHLVYPLRVVMPTYSYKMKSRPAMMIATLMNDIVGFDRNQLDDPAKYMPKSYTVPKKKVQDYIPGYTKYNLNGAAIWYDCQCYNTERLLLSFIISATERGAQAANYVQAVGFLRDGNRVIGIKVQDVLTGDKFDIRAKLVINNAGPWVDDVLLSLNGKLPDQKFKLSTAMNLVVNRRLMDNAAGLSGPYQYVHPDGSVYKAHRILFFAPWRDYTIIGTNHLVYNGKQDEYKVTEAEIQDFLAAVNQAYPGVNIKREEVTFFHGGFLPMASQNPKTGEVGLEKHYKIYDHKFDFGVEGLISVVGVKYTTARDVAQKTIDLAFKKMGRKAPKCQTEEVRLHGGNIDRFNEFLNNAINQRPYGLNEKVMKHLSYNYGTTYNEILNYGARDRKWIELLPGSEEVLKAEVLHGVREEMAQKLSDVVLRRTDLGTAMNPGETALKETAKIMAEELGWDEARMQREINEVKKIYVPA